MNLIIYKCGDKQTYDFVPDETFTWKGGFIKVSYKLDDITDLKQINEIRGMWTNTFPSQWTRHFIEYVNSKVQLRT